MEVLAIENPIVRNKGDEIRRVLRQLRPQRAIGYEKARFGRDYDGGYIHLDDFRGVDTALSLGINDDISWDCDIADRGVTIHQFDHTVDDPAPDDSRMVFSRTMISERPFPNSVSLEALVRKFDRGNKLPNIVLKMDIESAEWPVLDATPRESLARFSQITCEMHCFEDITQPEWRATCYRVLRKLRADYAPIHVHANNFAGFHVIEGVPVPCVLEVTWVNRSVYETADTDETFPGPLDMPCRADGPDHYLGTFRY